MTNLPAVIAAVQQHMDERINDERRAVETLRRHNLAKMALSITAIAGAVQDDMYDRFGIPMELYTIYLADVCDQESNWWGGVGADLIEECAAGRYPVAVEFSCNIGSNFADISYTVGGVKTEAGDQDSIIRKWQIEGANLGGNYLPDDKTLLELLSEEQ